MAEFGTEAPVAAWVVEATPNNNPRTGALVGRGDPPHVMRVYWSLMLTMANFGRRESRGLRQRQDVTGKREQTTQEQRLGELIAGVNPFERRFST